MDDRSEQVGEAHRAVAGAPDDLHHTRGPRLADGGEPERRDDHPAGGEGEHEARELGNQSGAEDHEDTELTEPQRVDEEPAADPDEQDHGQDRDRAGDEGDPGQSYPRALVVVVMSCTVSRTTPGGHSRTNSQSPESTTTTSSISPITGTKSGMTSSGEIT